MYKTFRVGPTIYTDNTVLPTANNTTRSPFSCWKKNQNAPRPSEHRPLRGENVVVFTLKTVLTAIQYLLFLKLQGKETNFRGHKLTQNKVQKNKIKIKRPREKSQHLRKKMIQVVPKKNKFRKTRGRFVGRLLWEPNLVQKSWIFRQDFRRRRFGNARYYGEMLPRLDFLSFWAYFVWAWFRQTCIRLVFYAGEIQNSNCRRLEMATYFFLRGWDLQEQTKL